MDELITTPFDRKIIHVGSTVLYSRPIEFEYLDGVPISATKYEAICPKCSQMLQYNVIDIIQINKEEHIQCACGYGKIDVNKKCKKEKVKLDVSDEVKIVVNIDCPFVDPMVTGIFTV